MSDPTPDLDQLESLEKAATPGPWEWDEPSNWAGLSARVMKATPYGLIATVQISGWKPRRVGTDNAALIAAARNALPWLLRAARERDELRKNVKDCMHIRKTEGAQYEEENAGLRAENARLRKHIERRASGQDPLTSELRARAEKAEARVKELEFAEAELKYRKMLTSPTPAQIEAAREALREAIEHLDEAFDGERIAAEKCRAALAGLEGRS